MNTEAAYGGGGRGGRPPWKKGEQEETAGTGSFSFDFKNTYKITKFGALRAYNSIIYPPPLLGIIVSYFKKFCLKVFLCVYGLDIKQLIIM